VSKGFVVKDLTDLFDGNHLGFVVGMDSLENDRSCTIAN